MSFFGKVYKYASEENFAPFVDQLNISPQAKEHFKNSKSEQKLVQNADGSYILSIIGPDFEKKTTFKSGVEFDEETAPGSIVKSTFVLDGNVLTHKQSTAKGIVTFKREFNDTEMKVTYTISGWNGQAVRYYRV